MKDGFYIYLPVGVEGDLTFAQFKKLCKHFDCEVQPKKKNDTEYSIFSEDAMNFFWLGANMAFQGYGSSLTETIKEKIKRTT